MRLLRQCLLFLLSLPAARFTTYVSVSFAFFLLGRAEPFGDVHILVPLHIIVISFFGFVFRNYARFISDYSCDFFYLRTSQQSLLSPPDQGGATPRSYSCSPARCHNYICFCLCAMLAVFVIIWPLSDVLYLRSDEEGWELNRRTLRCQTPSFSVFLYQLAVTLSRQHLHQPHAHHPHRG